MADCGNRHGSEIAGVRREDIEVLISAEKLRGTDFCVGAIGATTRRPTGFIHHDFLMRSPVNKSYILDILRQKPRPSVNGMVLGVAVGFFYKPWVIFSQRKSFNFFSIFFRTFWAHRSFFRTVLVRISLIAL